MDREVLEKIEEIYENNLVLAQFYNDISEKIFTKENCANDKEEIVDFIEDVKKFMK